MNSKSIALIIVAAGSSTRMGGQIKKEYLPLHNGTVLSTVALTFLKSNQINTIAVVIPINGLDSAKNALYKDPEISNFISCNNTDIIFVEGGKTRQESVYNALSKLSLKEIPPDYVLIHDGARPFLSTNLVLNTINYTIQFDASVPAVNPVDTQKEIDSSGFISRHLIRKNLKAVQTPQGFKFSEIYKCHQQAKLDNTEYTDDTEIYDRYSNKKTFVFDGEAENKKITYIEDIPQNNLDTSTVKGKSMFRTGIGYDKHRLVENRRLIIGGIEIPFDKGEDGHSDGDAVLHAVTDALLGASHKGDIGSYFPDTDPKYKDADSRKLLSEAWTEIQNEGWKLENLDIVILIEKPKFIPYREQVIHSIAETLNVSDDKVFIKAKTGEKLGDVGNSKCIEVFANCLISKNK